METKKDTKKEKKQIDKGINESKSPLVKKFIAWGILKVKFKKLFIKKEIRKVIKNQPTNRLNNKFLLIKILLLIK